MREIQFTIPWPPSVNHYYVRGRILSQEARSYRESAVWSIWEQCQRRYGTLHAVDRDWTSIEVVAFPPDDRKRDLDNLLKGLLDAIQHAQAIRDDSQLERILIERGRMDTKRGGCCRITLGKKHD